MPRLPALLAFVYAGAILCGAGWRLTWWNGWRVAGCVLAGVVALAVLAWVAGKVAGKR